MLNGRRILVGITGSIAAYKTILLVRELRKLGAEVQVLCTPAALDFVTPATLSTLSGRPVYSRFYISPETGEWVNHVDLAKWAELFIIAPLSAASLSKMANGQVDNLLLAVYLSCTCEIWVAPAMDLDMYAHTTTQANLEAISRMGVRVIPAESGELASGLIGQGRMTEPENLLKLVCDQFGSPQSKLAGKRILITAGPTIEPIDAARYISNYSTGKMGYAIAAEAVNRGASVILVSGPVSLKAPERVSEYVPVLTAGDMMNAVKNRYSETDILIMAAAVADYRVEAPSMDKQKKAARLSLNLVATEDILAFAGQHKAHQIVIGFALESGIGLESAREKLRRKNADMIVLNSLGDEGAGFGFDTNKVTYIFANSEKQGVHMSKHDVAKEILSELENLL